MITASVMKGLIVNMEVSNLISLIPVIGIPVMALALFTFSHYSIFYFLTVRVRNEITLVIFMEKRFLKTFLIVNILRSVFKYFFFFIILFYFISCYFKLTSISLIFAKLVCFFI